MHVLLVRMMTGWFISFILSFGFEYCLFGKSLVIHLSYSRKQREKSCNQYKISSKNASTNEGMQQCQQIGSVAPRLPKKEAVMCVFREARQYFLVLVFITAQENSNARKSFKPTLSSRVLNVVLLCAELTVGMQPSSLMWGAGYSENYTFLPSKRCELGGGCSASLFSSRHLLCCCCRVPGLLCAFCFPIICSPLCSLRV